MSAFTDAVRARYEARETEADPFDRKIEVGRLRPAAALAVRAMLGSEISSVVTEAIVAASVTAIIEPGGERTDLRPPRSMVALYAILDALEGEGMGAALVAYSRLEGVEPEKAKDTLGAAAADLGAAANELMETAEKLSPEAVEPPAEPEASPA